MVNTNIQGPVPINGRGMVIRPDGNYQPGEFKQLVNAEIIEDKIVSRRPIFSTYFDTDPADPSFSWQYRGHLGNHAIYVNTQTGSQRALTPNLTGDFITLDITPMFNVTDLIFHGDVGYGNLCYVFNYNNKNYWLMAQHAATDGIGDAVGSVSGYEPFGINFNIWSVGEDAGLTVDQSAFGGGWPYIAGGNAGLLSGFGLKYSDDSDPGQTLFKNAFMFRDRLWIVLDSGIYFSKATDPKVFTVPEGGFFKFPDDYINYVVGLRDTLYVFCENKIYTITYSTDPNTDVVVRVLTDQLGGSHATVHQDTVYFLNTQGVFVVSNNTFVDKVIDSFEVGATEDGRLLSFGKYLVINKYESPDIDLTQYVTRYNKFRNGFIFNAVNVALNFNNPTTGVTLSNDVAGGSVGFGLVNTNSLKANHDASANNLISWQSHPGIAGARHIDVVPGDTYMCSVYLKTNVADVNASLDIQFRIDYYDVNNINIHSDSTFGTLTLANGWKQFKFISNVGNNVAAGTASYARIYISAQKRVAGVLTNYTNGQAVFSNLYVVEVYKSATPYLFAANNMTISKLYDVNPIAAIGPQKVYFNPVPGMGLSDFVYNQYHRHDDFLGLGCQTIFYNVENKSLHAVTTPGRTTLAALSDDVVEDIAAFNIDNPIYSGPVLLFNSSFNSLGGFWSPGIMLENKELTVNLFGYRDAILTPALFTNSYVPIIIIEIDGFAPDGLKYLMKKFRSLEIQGKIPPNKILFQASYENTKLPSVSLGIGDTVNPATYEDRPHYPHRIGLNGRGRYITLMIYVDDFDFTLGVATVLWSMLEISDLRVLWGYSGRGPTTKQLS